MKLVYPDLFPPFEIYNDRINMLIIEDGSLHFRLTDELRRMSDGETGSFVLSEANKPVDISHKTDMITSFMPFEMNNKKLLTKLYSSVSDICKFEFTEQFSNICSAIENFFILLNERYTAETEFDRITDIKPLLKAVNFRFSNDYDKLSQTVIEYVLNVTELEGEKLFVFSNILCYFNEEESKLFFRTVTDHKIRILIIENHCPDFQFDVNRMVIDKDYCII